TEYDPRDDLDTVAVDRRDRVEQWDRAILRFLHGIQSRQFRRFDAAEDRAEVRFAHHRQNFRRFGDIEGRLTTQLHRVPAPLLPGDKMGQEFARRLFVADEIVVDEIDRGLDPGG